LKPTTVSILIPAYNRPELLAEAIASARAQYYPKGSYEVVVVHDGLGASWLPPSDDSPPVLRVRSIVHRGQGAAVNAAFAASRGAYVTVLQDDDTILPGKLIALAAMLDADPVLGGVYSLPAYVEADGTTPRLTPPRLGSWLLAHPLVPPCVAAIEGFYIHGMATMFRRSTWEKVGPWDEELTAGEEWDWHLRFFVRGQVLGAVDAVTTTYRHHPTQKSGRWRRVLASRRAVVSRIRRRHSAALGRFRICSTDSANPGCTLCPSGRCIGVK
jgi:glycosyltransferase involved in cell wall biosynthesis